MRPVVALALPLLLVSAFAACKSAEESSAPPLLVPEASKTRPGAPADAPRTVALVLATIANPLFVFMEKGARRAESELGIRLRVTAAPYGISRRPGGRTFSSPRTTTSRKRAAMRRGRLLATVDQRG